MTRKNRTHKQKSEKRPIRATEPAPSRPLSQNAPLRFGLLTLTLALAAFLRVNQLSSVPPGLSPDEGMEGNNAVEAIESRRLQVFYSDNNGREGLYANTAAAAIAILGNTKLALRLPAAISGILTVAGLYCLAAELFPIPVALLASFLLATSFWHIVVSRLAGHAIMAPLFLVWALYFLVYAVPRLGEKRFPLVAVLCGGFSFGLGFHSYTSFRIAPLLIGLLLALAFVHARSRGHLRPFCLLLFGFISAATLVCIPLGLYFARHPEMLWNRARQVSVLSSAHPAPQIAVNLFKTAQMFFVHGDDNWRHNLSGKAELFWPVALFFLAGCILSLRELVITFQKARTNPIDVRVGFRAIVALGWLLICSIPVVVSDEGMPHAVRSIILAPAVFLVAGCGSWTIYTWLAPKIPKYVLLAAVPALFAVLSVQPYELYFETWAKRPEVAAAHLEFTETVADSINHLPNEADKYIVMSSMFMPVRGIPLIAQSIMYLTGSFTSPDQARRHIYYITDQNATSFGIPEAPGKSICDRVSLARPDAEMFCLP